MRRIIRGLLLLLCLIVLFGVLFFTQDDGDSKPMLPGPLTTEQVKNPNPTASV